MTAEGGTSTWHSEVIYRGDTPFGPYKPWDKNPILTQRTMPAERPNPITCAGHADIVQTPEGDWWGVFLACRPVADGKENLGRETFMLPVKWTDDGWPYFLEEGEAVPMIVSKPGVTRGETTTFGNYTWNDDFDSSSLGLEWFTLRGPANEFYSLEQNKGYLTLKCGNVKSSDKAVLPFVGRRICHHNFSADTEITFVPENDSQCAGVLLMKDEIHQYFLAKTRRGNKHFVEVRKVTENGVIRIGEASIASDDTTVGLKVDGKGLEFSFSYSIDGGKTWSTVASGVDAGYTSTAVAGGFTGTLVGLYASDVDGEVLNQSKSTI